MFFVLLALSAIGFAVERAMSRLTKTGTKRVHDRSSADEAYLGMKHAEDWLITSVLADDFPAARKNSTDPDPMTRIEAVRNDGSAIAQNPGISPVNAIIYVADADYEEGLFNGKTGTDAAGLFIPRIPCVEGAGAECRFYYLMSASAAGGVNAVNEELLAVSRDRILRTVAVERIYYRSANSVR
jgi:hypothetical protein